MTLINQHDEPGGDLYEWGPSHLTKLKYGYRRVALEWEELVDIIVTERNLHRLSRSVPQQIKYELFRTQMQKEWRSMDDYVLYTKFGMEKIKGNEEVDSRWRVIHTPTSENRYLLCRNDFPYHFSTGIEHYVFWKLGGDVIPEEIEQAKQELIKLTGATGVLHWRNPPSTRSVPDIDHIHILCRKTT